MAVYYFEPIPRYTIWGGTACNRYFHQEQRFRDGVGQIWAFSAQETDSTRCISEPYAGRTLRQLWEEEPALFGGKKGVFPLIISLVAPEADLSLQVHPNDEQARRVGYPAGKNEAWYFIRCQEDAHIVYGHTMQDEAMLRRTVAADDWDAIPRYRAVSEGDFVYIPAGTMHAMGKGSIVYEIQQSTDVTYRFYDYHRKDAQGKERRLDLEEAIRCLEYGEAAQSVEPTIVDHVYGREILYIENPSFTVRGLEVRGPWTYTAEDYQLATVIRGAGTVDGREVICGDSFLLPAGGRMDLDGSMTIMMTTADAIMP